MAIHDGVASLNFDEHHESIDEARRSATRAALSLLLSGRSQESQRTATCVIVEQPGGRQVRFEVTLELTDFI